MAEGERATGTPNTIYDLSGVLFHALEGGASYDTYIQDAEQEGDQELADFFRRVRDEDGTRADEARRLIAERTTTGGRTREGTAIGAAASVSPMAEPSIPPPEVTEELPPTRVGEAPPAAEGGPPRTQPISAPPEQGDVPPRRVEEAPPPGTEPIREESPSRAVERETATTPRTPEEDLAPPGEELPPDVPAAREVSSARVEEIPPPPGTAGIEEGPLSRTEEVPPPRTEPVPLAEEVPSGIPPQAPPGDVQRRPSPEPTPGTGDDPAAEEERAGRENREEDTGFIDRAREYLRGEDRERDYLGGEDRER